MVVNRLRALKFWLYRAISLLDGELAKVGLRVWSNHRQISPWNWNSMQAASLILLGCLHWISFLAWNWRNGDGWTRPWVQPSPNPRVHPIFLAFLLDLSYFSTIDPRAPVCLLGSSSRILRTFSWLLTGFHVAKACQSKGYPLVWRGLWWIVLRSYWLKSISSWRISLLDQ